MAAAAGRPADLTALSDHGRAAVRLAELGLRVFPLIVGDKVPPGGRSWKATDTGDPEQAARLWAERPTANVAVVTAGLVVLDTDTDEAEAALEDLELPLCPTVRTARGYHRWFKGPGKSTNRTVVPDLHVKAGRGSYVVAPPSIHPVTDGRYEWEVAPWEVPPPLLPPTVAELLRERPSAPHHPVLCRRSAAQRRPGRARDTRRPRGCEP